MATLLSSLVEILISLIFDPTLWAALLSKADREDRELARWNRVGL